MQTVEQPDRHGKVTENAAREKDRGRGDVHFETGRLSNLH